MRLLTHNMMICKIKACVATANRDPAQGLMNYPLDIFNPEIEINETEYSRDFILHLLDALDWKALVSVVAQVNT